MLAGCGQVASPTSSALSPAPSETLPDDFTLPGTDLLIPDGVAEATPWIEMSSQPSEFYPDVLRASPTELADEFGAALYAAWSGGPERPDLDLDTLDETAERAVLIVSETGLGDDSVAGTQYALVVVREDGGWRLDELWTRALCWRGSDGELCV